MSTNNSSAPIHVTMQYLLVAGVHRWRLKYGGAFKDTITKDKTILEECQIMIESPLTTAAEKKALQACHDSFITLGAKFPGTSQLELMDMSPFTDSILKLAELSSKNAMPRGSKIVKLLMELPSKDRIVFSSCYLDDDDTLWVAPGDIASVPHKAPMEHCRQLDINWGNFAKFLKLVNFLGVDISDIMCSSEESASEDGAALENSASPSPNKNSDD